MSSSKVPQVGPTVILKTGDSVRPVFLAHGIAQSVEALSDLAQNLNSPNAVIGIQARGNDGIANPHDRMEEMVAFHLAAIKAIQPSGPYVLLGYSLGGLVMFEVARHLSANGEEIALVAMIDSYPHPRHLALSQRIQLISRSIGQRLRGSNVKSKNDVPDTPFTRTIDKVGAAARVAWFNYRPDYYSGEIKVARAETLSYFPSDAADVWRKLAPKIEVVTVPGDHTGMISTHSKQLAKALSGWINNAHQGLQR